MVKREKKYVSLFASFIMLSLIVILAACSSDKTSGILVNLMAAMKIKFIHLT